MRTARPFPALLWAVLWPLCVAGSAHGRAEKIDQWTLPGQGVRSVTLRLMLGTIRVYTDSPDAVSVRAVRSAGEDSPAARRWMGGYTLTWEHRGDAVIIEDRAPKTRGGDDDQTGTAELRLDVELHVPPRTNLVCDVAAGRADIHGEVGDASLQIGAGTVRMPARCAGRRLSVRVGAGRVLLPLLSLPSQSLDASVGAGSVSLTLPPGVRLRANAQASSRQVEVVSGAGGDRVLSSQSLSGDTEDGCRVDLRAATGTVQVSPPLPPTPQTPTPPLPPR